MGKLCNVVDVARRERGAVLMGIVNTTPDSFSDGGRFVGAAATAHIDELLAHGADIIDIGSESTRPGAVMVSADEQIARAEPALRHALARGAEVSIDTTSPVVARFALELGARLINDVSCLADVELARVAREFGATLLIMHSRGSMTNMPAFSSYPEDAYGDIVAEVSHEWAIARDKARSVGLEPGAIWFDPGLGFHKSARQSAELLQRLSDFSALGSVCVVGPSNKSFIGSLDQAPVDLRLGGTIAACLRAVEGGAAVLRVHDVRAVRQALLAWRAFAPRTEAAHA